LWTKKYGGNKGESCRSICKISDGGIVLGGSSASFTNGEYDFYLVRTNSDGDVLWTNHYGGNSVEICYAVKQTSEGGFIMAGNTSSFGAPQQLYVVKTNSSGDTLWTKVYGSRGTYGSRGYTANDIIQTSDGGFATVGDISPSSSGRTNDLYLIKTDQQGNIQWEREFIVYPKPNTTTASEGYSIVQTSDGGFAIAGSWFSGSTIEQLLVKTDNNGIVGVMEIIKPSLAKISPTIFNQFAVLQFENPVNRLHTVDVFDGSGHLVLTLSDKSDRIKIERYNLKSGLYFFQLRSENEVQATGKFIIE
jgi:hypothetical protein